MQKETMYKSLVFAAIATLGMQACKPSLEAPAPSAGAADFTKYVAIGNSLTAGYTNNGLFYAGQANSYPVMLHKQMQAAGGGAVFNMPYFPQGSTGSGSLYLNGFTLSGLPDLKQLNADPTQIQPSTGGINFVDVPDGLNLNNLGVPGIRVSNLQDPTYGVGGDLNNYNPYYERMLPDGLNFTYTHYVLQSKPTFFTCWLGNNDVLGYASDGATGSPITEQTQFELFYGSLIDSLTASGAKGLLANIPNVTSAPYFTTLPYNSVTLSRQGQVDSLNDAYADYNTRIDAINRRDSGQNGYAYRPHIVWKLGANPPVVEDPSDTALTVLGGQRQLVSGELVLLTASTVLGTGAGSLIPLPSQFSLTKSELDFIAQRTNQINTYIKTKAAQKNLAFFDSQQYLEDLKAGFVNVQGIQFSNGFITGHAFSLDGVHPTPQGYALIANQMIKAINDKYGANLGSVSVTDYPDVIFPQ